MVSSYRGRKRVTSCVEGRVIVKSCHVTLTLHFIPIARVSLRGGDDDGGGETRKNEDLLPG